MLERLPSIDWSRLSHAYGRADDVPQLIRDLASSDAEARGQALGTLYMNIYHQGTVYQASAYAAPFLIELVQQEGVPERDSILLLLAYLAGGNAYHRQHMRYYTDERQQDPAFQRDLTEQVFWVDRTYETVKDGIPIYLRLLEHQDVKMRMSVSRLLSAFQDDASRLLPVFSQWFQQERDQRVHACILYGVGVLVKYQDEEFSDAFQLLERCLVDGETELVRVAAAMAFVQTGRQDVPSRALDMLLETMVHPETVADAYEELPWVESRFVFDAIRCLYALPPSTRSLIVPRLIRVLDSVEHAGEQTLTGSIATDIAKVLINLAFGDASFNEQGTVANFTDEQHTVLIAIVNSDAVWKWEAGKGSSSQQRSLGMQEGGKEMFETIVQVRLCELLAHGLPDNRRDLRAFLRLEAQERDALHFFSRGQMLHWTLSEKKKEVVAELVQFNPQRTLTELKMLVGDYS